MHGKQAEKEAFPDARPVNAQRNRLKNLLTLKSLYSLLAVVAWTLLVYVVLEVAGKMLFSVEVLPQFWARDFFAHLVLSGLIFLMARNFIIYAIAYLLLMAILHISNNLKMVILGSPIMPDDFISVRNMFMLFNDWKLWLMVLMLIASSWLPWQA